MNFFLNVFYALGIICMLLFIYTRAKLPSVSDDSFQKFQRTYLIVYLLAMAGDWLQGPHVYALYDAYGMTVHQIEILFVAGFGSSMVVGTIIGSFADRYGRRANCILYGILYGLACVTKHFNNFWVLMVGRVLGGTATSILYSAFESWLIYEHNERGFDPDWLGNIFSHAVLGNSLVAIFAGLGAQTAADTFGFVAPFDLSLSILFIMCIFLVISWTENYGDKTQNVLQSFRNSLHYIKNDPKILCLGIIQSLFEGAMYVFVLEWTPALTPAEPAQEEMHGLRRLLAAKMTEDGHRGAIPHGQIFAAFMVAIMIGSSVFKLLSKYTSIESFMRFVLLTAAVSLVIPFLFPGEQQMIFLAFIVFEVCVGIFWPSMSTLRGKYVPEDTRATVMNVFRVPLNFIVVLILLQNLPMDLIFKCCVAFLVLASFFMQWLYRLYSSQLKPLPSEAKALPSSNMSANQEEEAEELV